MAEVEQEAKTYSVGYICDSCGYGLMELHGAMIPANPPKFPHKCSKCGVTQEFFHKYPYLRFESL